MSEKKQGKLAIVAKTGGIKLEGNDNWFNPTDKAKPYVSSYKKGMYVELTIESDGKFSFIKEADEPAGIVNTTVPLQELKTYIMGQKGMSNTEVDDLIKAKVDSLSGLVSEEGAAHIVANELGLDLSKVPKAGGNASSDKPDRAYWEAKDRRIVRQACIKAAAQCVEPGTKAEKVVIMATTFEAYVYSEEPAKELPDKVIEEPIGGEDVAAKDKK